MVCGAENNTRTSSETDAPPYTVPTPLPEHTRSPGGWCMRLMTAPIQHQRLMPLHTLCRIMVHGCVHTIFVPNRCLIAGLVRGAHELMTYFQRHGQNLSYACSHHERDVVNAKVCFGSTLCLRMQRSCKRCSECEIVFWFYTLSVLLMSLAGSQSVS